MRVSDYIVKTLYENGIDICFSITGGFSMFLNDSFGNHESFKVIYNHHEQACGYAAVGYTKTINKPSVVCTTAGIAATNAISPCLIAYQDSLPIVFINGQVKTYDTIRSINKETNNTLRNYAFADCDIISMISNITKYSCEIKTIEEVPYILETMLYKMNEGRPGPVWISIPLDIQGASINAECPLVKHSIPKSIPIDENIYTIINSAKRPVIIAGNGIKLANACDKFSFFVDKLQIPVVTSLLGIDLIETSSKLFSGRVGIYGDRLGNFTVQNSDLLIVLGCRLAQGVVGYNPKTFARHAKIIYIDIDDTELNKSILSHDIVKVKADLNDFFVNFQHTNTYDFSEWIQICNRWKAKWLFEMPPNILTTETINPYYALKILFEKAPPNKNVVSMTGSIVTILWHMIDIKNNDKFIFNSQGDMGPELAASIGTQLADPAKMVITVIGEGSLQFNIQELQTIAHHKLPIKIIVFNNAAYGAIDITQRTFFKNKFGVDSKSGLSFPDTRKISMAYGIHYIAAYSNTDLSKAIDEVLSYEDTVILEIFCCIQGRYPKLSSVKNSDGTFVSRPFEDMEPFMPRDEFMREMIIPAI